MTVGELMAQLSCFSEHGEVYVGVASNDNPMLRVVISDGDPEDICELENGI